MSRKKRIKLEEVSTFPNVFNFNTDATEEDLKKYFPEDKPITLEIGCGHGDYSINLGRTFPDKYFIGVDLKGARLHKGATTAINEDLNNVAFLWIAAEKLPDFFKKIKVSEIFIPFPEPHIKRRLEPRRLISQNLLDIYKKILLPEGKINFKTDDDFLYEYAVDTLHKSNVEIIFNSDNLYKEENLDEIKTIKTKYEQHYLNEGRTIKYIEFKFAD